MRRVTRALTLVAIALGLVLTSACSTPPKPKEMIELESLRKARYTASIRNYDKAREFLKASEDYYALTAEAYKDGEIARAKYYANLGAMRYRTAENLTRTKDARDRLEAANATFLKFQKIRNDRDDARKLILETIAVLEERKTMASKMANAQKAAALEKKKLDRAKLKADVQKTLDEGRVKQAEAEGLKAKEFAPAPYGQGANMLRAAKGFLERDKLDEALKNGKEAIVLLTQAIAIAKPKFDEEQNLVRLEDLKKKLFNEAHGRMREMVRIDGRGIVITVESLFKRRATDLDPQQSYTLDFIIELAKKYTDFTILIEGHTDGIGSASNNIAISQRRAEETKNYLLQRGIPAKRLQTAGAGGDKPFFKQRGRERFRNNRVDIVFLYNK